MFLIALGWIMGAAIVDMSLIGLRAVRRWRETAATPDASAADVEEIGEDAVERAVLMGSGDRVRVGWVDETGASRSGIAQLATDLARALLELVGDRLLGVRVQLPLALDTDEVDGLFQKGYWVHDARIVWTDGSIEDAENSCPHSSSVTAFTLRVETPCTYISTNADTSAFSLRWKRSNSAVENSPDRSRGTRSSILPTRVIRPRS